MNKLFILSYPVLKYQVETQDGYLLTVFRIPGKKNEKDYEKKRKQAVLLQHGAMVSYYYIRIQAIAGLQIMKNYV